MKFPGTPSGSIVILTFKALSSLQILYFSTLISCNISFDTQHVGATNSSSFANTALKFIYIISLFLLFLYLYPSVSLNNTISFVSFCHLCIYVPSFLLQNLYVYSLFWHFCVFFSKPFLFIPFNYIYIPK